MKKILAFLSVVFICTICFAHTINWHVDYQIISTTTCDSGDSITPPTVPAKYGYHLKEWIPEGYMQLEYIESTGTQYIDTGVVLDATMTVRVKYDFVAQGFVFGSRTSSSSKYSGITNEDSGEYNIRYGNKIIYTKRTPPTGTVDVVISPNGVTLNGEVVSTTSYGTNFYSGNCYLFTTNNNGNAYGGEFAVNRIRRFAIDNIIDLIPCRRNSNNALGMCDTVSGTFFTNAGTGEFIAGPEVDGLQ